MKIKLTTMLLIMVAATAFAANAPVKMAEDFANRAIQIFTPDWTKDVVLTGNRQTGLEVTNDLAVRINPSANGVYRITSSATRAGVSHKLKADTPIDMGIHHPGVDKKTYLHFSCAGTLQRR